MYPLGLIFFLLCLPMHACSASRLDFVAEETDNNHAGFLAKDVSRLKLHDDQPSISKQVETQISMQENLMGANAMKQTLLNSLLKAIQDVSKGYEIIISSGVGLHGMARVQGLEKVTRSRSMLGNSGGDTEEDVDSDENDNVDGDIDGVMDYSQPHRKPPIHNEKN